MAILNALKWAGAKVNVRMHLPFLEFSSRMHASPEDPGTLDADFDRVIRYVFNGRAVVRRPKKLTVTELERHIRSGGAAAVGYTYQQGGGHFTLLVGMKGLGFIAANDTRADKRRTISYKRRATVQAWLRNPANSFWLLEKKGLPGPADNSRDGKPAAKEKGPAAKAQYAGLPRVRA
jgi:hypothetical protein